MFKTTYRTCNIIYIHICTRVTHCPRASNRAVGNDIQHNKHQWGTQQSCHYDGSILLLRPELVLVTDLISSTKVSKLTRHTALRKQICMLCVCVGGGLLVTCTLCPEDHHRSHTHTPGAEGGGGGALFPNTRRAMQLQNNCRSPIVPFSTVVPAKTAAYMKPLQGESLQPVWISLDRRSFCASKSLRPCLTRQRQPSPE